MKYFKGDQADIIHYGMSDSTLGYRHVLKQWR